MKKRLDFVTNSSSSSYVCDICRYAIEVYDSDDLEYSDMYECEEGHVFCRSHVKKVDELDQFLNSEDAERTEVPSELCPICTMDVLLEGDILQYIYKTVLQKSFVEKSIREKFKTQRELLHYIKTKQQ